MGGGGVSGGWWVGVTRVRVARSWPRYHPRFFYVGSVVVMFLQELRALCITNAQNDYGVATLIEEGGRKGRCVCVQEYGNTVWNIFELQQVVLSAFSFFFFLSLSLSPCN